MVVEEVVVPRHVIWWLVTGSANHCLVEITISSKQTAGKQHRLSPTQIFFFVHATYCVTNLKYSLTKLRWCHKVNHPDVFRTSLIESSGRITEEIFDYIQVIFFVTCLHYLLLNFHSLEVIRLWGFFITDLKMF